MDRVLDRGIVIDAEMRLNVIGLNVVGIEARIVVAAIETYLEYADELSLTAPASWHSVAEGSETEDPSGPVTPTQPGRHRLSEYFDDDPGDGSFSGGD